MGWPDSYDVAVLRWEKAAGCEATLLETGETFAAVSARRKAEPDEEAASNA